MKLYRRALAALLIAAAAAASSLTWGLAAPESDPFAEFRIDASGRDVVEREISVDIYRREGEQFQLDASRQYSCRLNRVTRDASFFIQTNQDGVWVTVDYLTDVDGDGTFELLVDDGAPVWDVMDAQGGLTRQQEGAGAGLAEGRSGTLARELRLARSQRESQERACGGAAALDISPSVPAPQRFPLCMVQLHHSQADGGQDTTQTYYLQLCGKVLVPTDVSPSDWYYDAVEYALEQGYFAGSDAGLFLPDEQLTRAQLAQVLWTMDGCQQAPAARFFDVAFSDWYYQAVAWCKKEEIIAGYTSYLFAPGDFLTREQMLTVLHRYAQRAGSNMRASVNLSAFSDWDEVSSWAVESMRWALTHKLISDQDGALCPGQNVSRAELAAVLYAYELNLSLYR